MESPTYASFSKKVFEKFEENITEKVFKLILEDPELQKDYLDLIASKGQRGRLTVNSWLGKQIETRYKLKSAKQSEKSPKTTQLQGYTKLQKNNIL